MVDMRKRTLAFMSATEGKRFDPFTYEIPEPHMRSMFNRWREDVGSWMKEEIAKHLP